MFNNINRALDNWACKGAVLKTYSNGNKLIDANVYFGHRRLIGLGEIALVLALGNGLGAIAKLVDRK